MLKSIRSLIDCHDR